MIVPHVCFPVAGMRLKAHFVRRGGLQKQKRRHGHGTHPFITARTLQAVVVIVTSSRQPLRAPPGPAAPRDVSRSLRRNINTSKV